jgi:transposase-like protein
VERAAARAAQGDHQPGPRGRFRRRDDRARRLRQARLRRPQRGQLKERHARQDGADRNADPVTVEIPRDRDGKVEPVIFNKRQRRLTGVDAVVLSLYARGLTTKEISAHFAEIYGTSVSEETVSRITDKVVEVIQVWSARPLHRV